MLSTNYRDSQCPVFFAGRCVMKFRMVRFVNTRLLALLGVLTLTGVYGLFWISPGWFWDIHRAAGWGLVAVIPWKIGISLASLRRGLKANFDRGFMIVVSLLLAFVTILVLVLGVGWNWRFAPESLPLRQTAISWHWMLALGLLLPLALHVWRRWPRPRPADLISRRAALKLIGLGAASLVGWWTAEKLARLREVPDAVRRISGSRLSGYYSGNSFPITHTRAASREQVDPQVWRLEVGGQVEQPLNLDYEQLLSISGETIEATIDCTLGWYSIQEWSGVPLTTLLSLAGVKDAAGVRFESVTGYSHSLTMSEARMALLATHIGGETLEHLHGFPVRLVLPGRRGWFWVKWLRKIEVIGVTIGT